MFRRISLSLALAIAVIIAPAAPLDIAQAFTPKKMCCSVMHINPCHCCPISSGQSSSSAGSTCCSAQAPCFVIDHVGADHFIAGIQSRQITALVDEQATARSQPPPVPPPRLSFS